MRTKACDAGVIRDDIEYDMNLIDQWYNKSLQVLEKRKEVKRQSKHDKRNNRY
ncbi:hypothetical protein RhiirA4_453267 [Rhizophagus irregularis]|uniref:Uncharacterized protein n=1 Tax=Rhizophagus irregularis TaxID=588596 RepID=A0A2I1G031_9GLOM|nr:hypothetical protein RhiirA4_453267 [Rhizophagus irregularis]